MSQLLTGEFPDKSVMLGSAEASRSRAAISGSVAKCRGVEPVPFWTETSENFNGNVVCCCKPNNT